MEVDMTAWIWMLMGLLGLTALGVAMYYGQFKTTHPRHTPEEDRRRDRATRELYDETEHEREARDA